MNMDQQQLAELLGPAVESLGFELADLEYRPGRGAGMLRLYIDQESGISLADCELVSQQVSALLDVEDPIAGHYRLEVSSPGLDRKLVKAGHFDRFAGCVVKLKLRNPLDGQRKLRGRLLGREGERVIVETDGGTLAVPMSDIDVARLVPEVMAGHD